MTSRIPLRAVAPDPAERPIAAAAATTITTNFEPADALDQIAAAAATIAECYPEIAAYIASIPPGLIEHLSKVGTEAARRDDLLRLAAGGLVGGKAARDLHQELARYKSSGWNRDKRLLANPYELETVKACLWSVLKIKDAILGERQIERILAS